MSRAFVSEAAEEASAAALPERPISDAPNLVTPHGVALIDAEIARLQADLAAALTDDPARAGYERDLRYWRARRASAQTVPGLTAIPEEVVFGCTVTVRRAGAGTATYTIVGEDEADPRAGLLAWSSPLATALLGAGVGDTVETGGGRAPVSIEQIGLRQASPPA
jgi:transcription elongation GreA/GreB family factor